MGSPAISALRGSRVRQQELRGRQAVGPGEELIACRAGRVQLADRVLQEFAGFFGKIIVWAHAGSVAGESGNLDLRFGPEVAIMRAGLVRSAVH
jgi:hypothetical protein